MVDIHTHFLPGVDDGARDMEDTLEMARVAVEDGITTVAATPHAYWQSSINTGSVIESGIADIRKALRAANIPLEILPGCEVPMSRSLVARVSEDPAWTLGGNGAYLLLEPPWGPLPSYCFDLIEQLLDSGITPVIAHPERSPDLQANLGLVDRMVRMGALTQVTGNSILGRHGSVARAAARRLLEAGAVHVIASDCHNFENRAPVLSEAREFVSEMLGEEAATRMVEQNPQDILEGLPIVVTDSVELSGSAEKSGGLGGLFRRLRGR